MGDDRCLSAGVIDRLLHRGEHVQVLHSLHFEMQTRQLRTNYVGIPRGTAILLTAERFEESCLAELIPPKALDPFAFLS